MRSVSLIGRSGIHLPGLVLLGGGVGVLRRLRLVWSTILYTLLFRNFMEFWFLEAKQRKGYCSVSSSSLTRLLSACGPRAMDGVSVMANRKGILQKFFSDGKDSDRLEGMFAPGGRSHDNISDQSHEVR